MYENLKKEMKKYDVNFDDRGVNFQNVEGQMLQMKPIVPLQLDFSPKITKTKYFEYFDNLCSKRIILKHSCINALALC